MPTLPPGLSEWLPSGFFTAFLGLIWYEVKAGEARVNRWMDDLRDGVNKRMDELRDDLNASESRQREDVKDLRDKVDALPLKIMELLRQPVTPER
ncbi:MAG: hypothetical protein OXI08_03215 [Cyanobacteria bacterium MAG IRC4_bin_6]|nr:hypothetical protein [Cyanobacteria bacterium MAG IRC4_bin_6]MXY19300.1 hypothetical protein [Synechococcus sp. SB0664_bin_36]